VRCPSSLPPCPTCSEAEHVFPVATHRAQLYIYVHRCMHVYLYAYIPSWSHGSQTHNSTQSTPKNTNSTKSLILLSSLVEQDGGSLVRIYTHICIYRYIQVFTMRIPPTAGLRQPVCPVAAPGPLLMAPGHMRPKDESPTPAAGTDHLSHTHRAGQSSLAPQWATLCYRKDIEKLEGFQERPLRW